MLLQERIDRHSFKGQFVSAVLIAASDSNAWYHDLLLHYMCWSVGHVLCIHCCIDLLPLILLSSALLLADVEDQARALSG